MSYKLDDLLGDVNDDQLVLNDDYMHQLESMGKLASKQRRDALLSTVQVSKGVARAGIRAIKQAIASELQKISAKRRNLDTKDKDVTIIEKGKGKEIEEIEETESTSNQKEIEESLVIMSNPMSNLAQEYSELVLRIRALDPMNVFLYVMKKHSFVLSSDSILALSSASPESSSKKGSREHQTLDHSSELDLIFTNKLYQQWEKSLIRWVRASMHTNAKALKQDNIQIEENVSTTALANTVNIEKEGVDDVDLVDEDESTSQSLPQTLSSTIKPSNRQLKREQRELLKRAKMHIHGRGAGYGRGLSKSGEPTFEDLHPSWRLKKIIKAKQAKLVEKSLKKKVV